MPDPAAWAKAPDFADRRELAARLHAETAADKQHYITGGLRPVQCRSCGACVLVKKNSRQHTSIQWTTDPPTGCPELGNAARAEAGTSRVSAVQDTCSRLRASIAYAVAEGLLDVGSPGEHGECSD